MGREKISNIKACWAKSEPLLWCPTILNVMTQDGLIATIYQNVHKFSLIVLLVSKNELHRHLTSCMSVDGFWIFCVQDVWNRRLEKKLTMYDMIVRLQGQLLPHRQYLPNNLMAWESMIWHPFTLFQFFIDIPNNVKVVYNMDLVNMVWVCWYDIYVMQVEGMCTTLLCTHVQIVCSWV